MPDNKGHLLPVYVVADELYLINPKHREVTFGMDHPF